jgi:hypothetical protein
MVNHYCLLLKLKKTFKSDEGKNNVSETACYIEALIQNHGVYNIKMTDIREIIIISSAAGACAIKLGVIYNELKKPNDGIYNEYIKHNDGIYNVFANALIYLVFSILFISIYYIIEKAFNTNSGSCGDSIVLILVIILLQSFGNLYYSLYVKK